MSGTYSELKNVQVIVSLLKQYGIDHIVLSPGGRNVPLVHSVENDPFFTCYSITDERSAGFFAIGLIQKLEKPVAICCTSGTAVCNYASSVNEAYYQKLPLVVLTADRNGYYLNQLEDQMIPQPNQFAGVVKKAVNLPIAETESDVWYCEREVNSALLEMEHRGRGPVHINFAVESIYAKYNLPDLPIARKIDRLTKNDPKAMWNEKVEKLKSAKRIAIIYGQRNRHTDSEQKKVEAFFEKFNCVFWTDHLSNYHGAGAVRTFVVSNAMEIENLNELLPDIVISMNGNFISNIRKWFKTTTGKFEHWLVSEEGQVADPFKNLSTVFECSCNEFLDYFVTNCGDSANDKIFYNQWLNATSIDVPDFEFCNLYALQKILPEIPPKSVLHIANSNVVRVSQLFSVNPEVEVYCNRGTNGIDGSMSAFVGNATVNDGLSYLLIGDLSFFYDMNALWNRYVGNNIRILLINNGGGGLFHISLGMDRIPTIDMHTAAGHDASAKGWAESRGFLYLTASNKEEFDCNVNQFMTQQSNQPILFEVFTDMENDKDILKKLYHANKIGNLMKGGKKAALKAVLKKITK